MAQSSIFTDEEISFLKELNKQNVDYIIVGLSAAALQGAPVVTQDIDIWFKDIDDPGIKKAVKKTGGVFVPSIGENPPMLAGESVKLFDIVLTMHGLNSFSDEVKNTIKVPIINFHVKVLKLERIIKSKETIGRQKDLLVLPVLKDVLKTIQIVKKKKKKKI